MRKTESTNKLSLGGKKRTLLKYLACARQLSPTWTRAAVALNVVSSAVKTINHIQCAQIISLKYVLNKTRWISQSVSSPTDQVFCYILIIFVFTYIYYSSQIVKKTAYANTGIFFWLYAAFIRSFKKFNNQYLNLPAVFTNPAISHKVSV